MRASIKYLRKLGRYIRKGGDRKDYDINSNSYNGDDDVISLVELRECPNDLHLNADELEYIDLAKEYRQYDEKIFKAFREKCE